MPARYAVASIAGRLALGTLRRPMPPWSSGTPSVRRFPPGTFGEDVQPDRPTGVAAAEGLGFAAVCLRYPSGIRSSPLSRCTDTASAIARGAGWEAGPSPRPPPGRPRPLRRPMRRFAALFFLETGIRELVRRQLVRRATAASGDETH